MQDNLKVGYVETLEILQIDDVLLGNAKKGSAVTEHRFVEAYVAHGCEHTFAPEEYPGDIFLAVEIEEVVLSDKLKNTFWEVDGDFLKILGRPLLVE